jgi:DNA primase
LTERVKFTAEASKLIAKVDSAVERDAFIKQVASETGISAEAMAADIETAMSRPLRAPKARVLEPAEKSDKGVFDAKRGLVYCAASDPAVCAALQGVLDPSELGGGIHQKLLTLIYSLHNEAREIVAAALISEFDDLEDQKQATAIFLRNEEYPDKTAREKAVNEMLKVLKKSYIDNKIPTADINQLNELVNLKKNVDKLYISI